MFDDEVRCLGCFFDEFDQYAETRGLTELAKRLRSIRALASAEFTKKNQGQAVKLISATSPSPRTGQST